MLGWSMNLFRVRGIQLAVHFSFFILVAFVAYEGWKDGGGASAAALAAGESEAAATTAGSAAAWFGIWWNVALLLVFFTCVVLHELGHSFTAMRFGVGVRRILLMPIGGMAEFDSIPREPGREVLITLAGPAVNFVIAAILAVTFGLPDNLLSANVEIPANLTGFAQIVLFWNLLMGCFNLVPVFPMDGGRIFRALLATRLRYVQATFVAATVGKVLAVTAALLAIFVFDRAMTAALFGFIFVAGEMEYRAVKHREVDDAHWRAVFARLYASGSRSIEEPPLLTR